MYHTGSISGFNDPTVFLIESNKRRRKFTDKWLTNNAADIGSMIIMAKTVFMTKESWEKFTPHVFQGVRQANTIVAVNP